MVQKWTSVCLVGCAALSQTPVAVWNTVNLLLKLGWVFGPDSTLALFHMGCSSLVMPQSCTGWAGEPALRVEGGGLDYAGLC